jgi:3-methyl-2-oxobutanoate hydroxymethyltransferase
MDAAVKKVRVPDFAAMKARGERITMLTAYDYTMAKILDKAAVDALLVGDSLGNVQLGYDNTLPVTLEDMIHHTQAVSRACKRALVVADMPFLSYGVDINAAVYNAGRLIKEGGADAVKIEGAGSLITQAIARMVEIGIPVVGHLGLTPQSIHRMGGYRVQAKTPEGVEKLLADAAQLQEAGIFALTLEGIPAQPAAQVTASLRIPTIGIGAGAACDGQVLVCYDALGMVDDLHPKFVKQFGQIGQAITEAVQAFCREVKDGTFPGPEHTYGEYVSPAKSDHS